MIRVVVAGAVGRMGREVVRVVTEAEDMELVGVVDREGVGQSVLSATGFGSDELMVTDKLGECLDGAGADVLVDFTHMSAAADHALSAIKRGVAPIIGTSGLSIDDQNAIRTACSDFGVPAAIIPNFAIGAVLMVKFAEMAAPFLPHCEVIELHHDQKLDAPSGTAIHTAERISEARSSVPEKVHGAVEKVTGARGGEHRQVSVHSVRLPGYVASQEVLFGGSGERLSLRHDSIDRNSFMGGVLLSVRQIRQCDGLMIGLDRLMFGG
ncbi:MAG: 4-hydroxy-tetrahydrodipicolinate reductase [Armatimonadetes bacterium]|nr:4-hydroxy-tetrahydrodipicolinate reductase [Armatimonadota bacterium]